MEPASKYPALIGKALFMLLGLNLLLAAPASAGVIAPGLEAVLLAVAPETEIPVLITMAAQADLHQFKKMPPQTRRPQLIKALKTKAAKTQRPVLAVLRQERATKIKKLWLGNRLAATVAADRVRHLARHPAVASIRLDRKFTLSEAPPTQPPEYAGWNIDTIGARAVWDQGYRGEGIVVASLDSGVDPLHRDLAAKWRGLDGLGNSWFDPHGEHPEPYDADGHGTRVMGIMVGGDAGGSWIGVAPEAQWIAVKIFNDAAESNYSAVHLGFQWLLDPDGDPLTNDSPDLVNSSWNLHPTVDQCLEEFRADIQVLNTAGIAVVFSAGNDGSAPYTSSSPANYPESFPVGASDALFRIASFSSRGPSACDGAIYPEVVAPGVGIRTVDLTANGLFPDSYVSVSGTSFAAPHVSGAMALLLDAFPHLTPEILENSLKNSALPLGAAPNHESGYGQIEVMAAFELVSSICEGDFDADGDVDISDTAVFRTEFGRLDCSGSSPCQSDLDRDGDVDLSDLAVFRVDYGRRDCPDNQLGDPAAE